MMTTRKLPVRMKNKQSTVKTVPNEEFAYLKEYGNRSDYEMLTSFEKCNFKRGKQFHFRITQIYDPSKFWIVVKYKELEVFQKYLFKFYYLNRIKYKVPEDKLAIDMYCVCFTDGGYYRGVIVGPAYIFQDQVVQVYFLDYGTVKVIRSDDVFYMSEDILKVPQFAIRSSLAGICPKKEGTWTAENVAEFHKLVDDKILQGIAVNVNSDRKVVEIHFSEEINGLLTIPVHKMLIMRKHARYFDEDAEFSSDSPYAPKLKYPYLFPTHSMLESGKVPQDIKLVEYLHSFPNVMCSSLMSRFYEQKN